MVTHTATHRETGCVDTLRVDTGDFFELINHCIRELDVVVVGAARTDVPAVTHSTRFAGAVRIKRDYAFGVSLGFIWRTSKFAITRTANRVVVNNERYGLVALVGTRNVHDEGALLAIDGHGHVLLISDLCCLASAVDDDLFDLGRRGFCSGGRGFRRRSCGAFGLNRFAGSRVIVRASCHLDLDASFDFGLSLVGGVLVTFQRKLQERQRIAFFHERHGLAELVGAAVAVSVDAEELGALGGALVQVNDHGTHDVMLRFGEGDFAESVHDGNGNCLGLDTRNADDVVVKSDGCLCHRRAVQSFGPVGEGE